MAYNSNNQAEKPPCPVCFTALELYFRLRDRLIDYFFNGHELNISNSQSISSYSNVFNLLEKDPATKLKNEKTYQLYEETFSKIFKKDLNDFCKRISTLLAGIKGVSSPVDELSIYYDWIINYTRFLHWTFKTFMMIEKNNKAFGKTSLFHQGLLIMRDKVIIPNYDNLFALIIKNLDLFKEGKLKEYFELQFIILTIGACGFSKYKSIKLIKNCVQEFQFTSSNNIAQKAQIEYETEFFLKNFTTKMIKHLQNHYSEVSEKMIQLSTSEYVSLALEYLKREEDAAEYFYQNASVKKLIINSIQEVLITRKTQQLLKNEKTGLFVMVETDNLEALKNLYRLLKRTSQHKLFAKTFQSYIEKKVLDQFLMKITPEEEKAAKKETVSLVINLVYDFYAKIDKMVVEIHSDLKDPQDLTLFASLTSGFQTACNRSNTICNFLALYCDNALKKQDSSDNNVAELASKISKISKLLYSMDNFLKIYQRLLGIRILYDIFKNRETQIEIINNLKNQVGVGSMAKINSMISDFKFSENFNMEKVANFKNKLNFNFQVMILTTGSWQIHDHKNQRKLVPSELVKAVELYENQYKKMLPGREINWVFNYGRGIVHVRFQNFPKALLFLNNYQLLIVLYFQRRQFFSCKISTMISDLIPEEDASFMASLQGLVKRGIVVCKTGNPLKVESKDDIVEFNLKFKPKGVKTFCFDIPRFTEKTETITKELLAERALIIQANIVKLMKAKRVLHYHEILKQIPVMCKTFKAEVGAIKNQIENSIHKDYLERDSKDINILIYKP